MLYIDMKVRALLFLSCGIAAHPFSFFWLHEKKSKQKQKQKA